MFKTYLRHKLLIGLLVAAVGAWVMDRRAGSTPASAFPASTLTGAPLTPNKTLAALQTAASAASNWAGLSKRLNQLSPTVEPSRVPDVFARDWQARHQVSPYLLTQQFQAKHQLSAVFLGKGAGDSVIVDGQTLSVGQSIDGFQLTRIDPRSAMFSTTGGFVVLQLPE